MKRTIRGGSIDVATDLVNYISIPGSFNNQYTNAVPKVIDCGHCCIGLLFLRRLY